MSVLRSQNWLGQQRVDLLHLRSIESSICADFDVLSGTIIAGQQPLIVSGFNIAITGTTIGSAATALQLKTANGIVLNYLASEAGSLFKVPANRTIETLNTTNVRIVGSFTANQVNYIGLDIVRSADSSTSDVVQFIDGTTLKEKPKDVPLGRTLDYKIVISTADFSTTPGLAPVAKVTTDANNNVTAIQDARKLLYRLGSGGSVPDIKNAYSWPAGRKENTTGDVFIGGDKPISSLKDWSDSVMTRLWELGGGEYWYSPTADRNVQMIRSGATFTAGEYFEWDATHLHWKGLTFTFDNSTAWYNDVKDQTTNSTGLTDLANNGDCIYIDLDRTANRTGGTALQPVKGTLLTLGTGTIPGSRQVIAWRSGGNIYTRDAYFYVGSAFAIATTTALGMVKLSKTPLVGGSPVVLTNTEKYPGTGALTNQLAVLTGAFRVIGSGLERDALLGAGALLIGTSANDSSVTVGKVDATVTVNSNITQNGGSVGVNTPMHTVVNTAGTIRHLVDHNGFQMGRISEFREEWQGAVSPVEVSFINGTVRVPSMPRWNLTGNSATGNLIVYTETATNLSSDGNAGPCGNVAQITTGTVTASKWFATTYAGIFATQTWVDFAAEWECAITEGNPTNADIFFGFGENYDLSDSANDQMCIFKSSTNTHWQCRTYRAGVVENNVTSITQDADKYYRMRIEYHGSATGIGTSHGIATVMFFINETLVATHTTNPPRDSRALQFSFGLHSTGTIALTHPRMTPLLCRWNRYTTTPSL